ncbi:MAG TPA: aspartate--tRNA ligase, partial [Candidatus Marinimicrobia bacterium]|nr:aspartate--tRNA ligase [Candidatus Neomarinimicrobiota bacterium]
MDSRTHNCGALTKKNIDKNVRLFGWINSARTHGKIIFIDIRDRFGKTQIILNTDSLIEKGKTLSNEDVISVSGTVIARSADLVNKNITTGEIEVVAEQLEILNVSAPLPMSIHDREASTEEHRLKYRYLELRNSELQNNLILRHKTTRVVRNFLNEQDFIEIETPVLTKSTPEGARDYLVPSRVHNGKFYALPQSPQMYKQLFMISGLDRYFQIVKCFRDEDLRSDRQPEFTQIDLEMSFVDEEHVRDMVEQLIATVFDEVNNVKIQTPFLTLSYEEAMKRFGTDKPDLRYSIEIQDFKKFSDQSDFQVFKSSESVQMINVDNSEFFSRKIISELDSYAQSLGAKGLAWMKYNDSAFEGGISKFFNKDLQSNLVSDCNIKNGSICFMVADSPEISLKVLGKIRVKVAGMLRLYDDSVFKPVWIVDFPLFNWDEDNQRFDSVHHPFV